MAMFKCTYCKFDAMYADLNLQRSYCPVCGYIQGLQDPSSEQVTLAKRILKIALKLKQEKFPFELDNQLPLVKRPEIINWLMRSEKA